MGKCHPSGYTGSSATFVIDAIGGGAFGIRIRQK